MRAASYAIIILLASVFQFSFVSEFSHKNIIGDLPTLVTISIGIFSGPFAGIMAGFASGMLNDFSSSTVIGVGVLTFTTIGFIAGMIKQNVHAEDKMPLSLLVGFMTFIKYILYGIFFGLTGSGIKIIAMAKIAILPSVTNLIIFFLFFSLIVFIFKRSAIE